MSVKIRLKRLGKVRVPQYRIVVVDSRKKRDGKVIEEIGLYHPKEDPSYISVVSDRAQYWLGVGAQPSETVAALLKVTGDWQKFRGISGSEGHLQSAPEKKSKLDLFNEALKEVGEEPTGDAVTAKTEKKAEKKADKQPEKKAEEKVEEKPAETEVPADETPSGATAEAESAEADAEPSS